MTLQLVSLGRTPAQAWRNGGGSTRELLAWPSATGWQLRISVADITQDGPFSAYPGVARWFAVIDGAGVLLHGPDGQHLVDARTPPFAFDGADAPDCRLLAGATRDLNLMARKATGHATMLRADPAEEWISIAPLRAFYAATPLRLQIDDTDAAQMPAHTLAWSTHGAQQRWRMLGNSGIDPDAPLPRGWWMSFEPVR